LKILGIETSCDETAASVVENGIKVLSNVIASSVDMHAKTGGVVPEVAAREHIRQISPVIDKAMEDAEVSWDDIDAIAVTHAPGLASSLLIGLNTAQTLAYIHKKPLIPIHHIAGHIYANFLDRESEIRFPIIVLTVSGGHNELVLVRGHYDFEIIGETLDDAAGEAFDKVARMLDLGFPGGPAIAKAAENGSPTAYSFPRSYLDKNNKYNFSFSGLKTAVKTAIHHTEGGIGKSRTLTIEEVADLAASFQQAVIDVLSDKLLTGAGEFGAKEVHLAGGVSANQLLRKTVSDKLENKIPLVYPKNLIYCTDNAAMIAGAGYFLSQKHPDRIGDWKGTEVYSQLPLA
jgi:N6-L-threonylcarbamoyladenine synthase